MNTNNNNLNETQSRGQNALQRRAQQLKRWNELQSNDEKIERKSSKTRVQFSSTTLFLSAVSQNDIEECERLLSSNECDVNVTTGDGLTALHQMAIDDNRDMVLWLINNNADVNCRDNEGWTPLHASASCGHLFIVQLLLSREECDVFAINCDGELARDVCDGEECLQLIENRMKNDLLFNTTQEDNQLPEELLFELRRKELILIENDFKEFLNNYELNEKNIKEWIERTRDNISKATVIHVCAAKGYQQLLEIILNSIGDKIDLDSFVDCDGFTPLHASAFWQQLSTFELLLKFGANYELKTRDSRLITDLCHENPKILELISEIKIKRESEKTSQSLLITGSETQRRLNAKRQRESRRSTQGVAKEDIEMALKTNSILSNEKTTTNVIMSSNPPPMPSSPPPMTTTATITLPLNDENGHQIVIHNNSQQQQLVVPQQRRRQKRRSTGIAETIEPDLQVLVATPHDMTDNNNIPDNNDCVVDSSILSTSSPSSTTTSRSSSRTSINDNLEEKDVKKDEEKDYKKLYFEVLKENEFLIKKIKDFENNRKYEKEFQEFQREKRQLLRRIGELEEELKIKEDLLKDNLRLKDENSALIRVISKLSK